MKLDTIAVQGGYKPKNGEPRVLPIYQSTTFKYDTAEQLGRLFDLQEEGFFYSRLANPTVDCVERKIAELEGGVACVLTSSGQAANMLAVMNICSSGDHIVSAASIYGGTFNLFAVTLRRFGIETTFVDADAPLSELEKAFRPNTRLVFAEILANPALKVLDIEKFAHLAHSRGVPLIVDNTFPTPINCRPFEWGADIVTHSTTKYMDGHAQVLGGAIVDSGNFDWTAAGKYPELTTPDDSYHGIVYTDAFGKAAYATKIRTQLIRDMGVAMTPNSAYILNLGLETLPLRMARHCENAQKVAEFLSQHEKVSWVNYPGLKDNAYHALAQKYMPNGTCGVISFGVKGGRETAAAFMEALKIAQIVIHVADARTCVLHPASTTHRQLSDHALAEAGVSPDLIRISVGIENPQDIIDDLAQALEQV
ncbi:MAG: O-acetylhomoserine aminocarboxypropyltransferase/cysteine synthase family protein [Christensenellales bacterium]|jgi:O-acetylhomoserine (thiol)-lyase